MKNYKGYYIDSVTFNSEADIDAFITDQAVNAYVRAVKHFAEDHSMESALYADEKGKYLVDNCGYTWEAVEELEIKTLKAI